MGWINDEVINCYGEMISQCSNGKIFYFCSFFFKKLDSHGYKGVKRWSRKINIFKFKQIFIPIHCGGEPPLDSKIFGLNCTHWALGVIGKFIFHTCWVALVHLILKLAFRQTNSKITALFFLLIL